MQQPTGLDIPAHQVVMYTDGACDPNPGIGGWGVILLYRRSNGKVVERILTGGELETTNNRMEMQAVLEGLRAIQKRSRIIIHSDSQYVVRGLGGWQNGQPHPTKVGWVVGWKHRGWRRKDGPVLNIDIWKELHEQAQRHIKITVKHVKGHSGEEFNERCDELAVAARLQILEESRLG